MTILRQAWSRQRLTSLTNNHNKHTLGLECRTADCLQCVITEGVPQSQNAVRKYTTEVMSQKNCLQCVITDEAVQSSSLGARIAEEVTYKSARVLFWVKGNVNCLQWLAEKLAKGACSLMPILRQALSRQRLTSPASNKPPQQTKQGATSLLPPVCAQNRTRMTHCRQSAVRHHRGSAAVAICGAEIHDRGNLQYRERAILG